MAGLAGPELRTKNLGHLTYRQAGQEEIPLIQRALEDLREVFLRKQKECSLLYVTVTLPEPEAPQKVRLSCWMVDKEAPPGHFTGYGLAEGKTGVCYYYSVFHLDK